MKILMFFLIIFLCSKTVKPQSMNRDTIVYSEITLETGIYLYFFPNGKYLCCYDEQNLDFRKYGEWQIKGDSVRVHIKFLHNYVNRSIEEKIDTSYYQSYKLNSSRIPITPFDLSNIYSHPIPKDVYLDRLK